MAWIIIVALLTLALIVIGFLEDGWDAIGPSLGCIFIAGILVVFANSISSLILSQIVDTQPVLAEEIKIVALQDGASSAGRFFLGAGHTDDKVKYYYLEETEQGKHIASVDARNSYIIESNSETPRIETYKYEWKNKGWKWLALISPPGRTIKIYIPENSVTTDFNVDLQ